MKILVVSDNHSDRAVLSDLFTYYRGEVDGIFHCGDSELPSDDPIWQGVYVVKGNCDFDNDYPNELTIDVSDNRIFMTHGHLYQVKANRDILQQAAVKEGANMALYGHTHELKVEQKNGVLCLNPGSISLPRGNYLIKTYAIITTNETEIQVQYYTVNHEPIKELAYTFSK